jgi:phosphohistidine swiveling domain-containing protein
MSNEQHVPFVLALDDPAATLELVGGKGASLARMAKAGLPVPHGFHITTNAYRRFVAQNGLQEQILATASAINTNQLPIDAAGTTLSCPSDTTHSPTDTIKRLTEASQQIANLFAQSTMPDDIAEAIRQAYTELGGDELPVAVRSSATAEDLPEISFAGQQETYLNMHGAAMVLDAVKRCWASLWTARAISYRAEHHIASQDVSLAVVMQKLVPADTAGILFTANPLTGVRNQVLINAAWGLGEAIVSGQVTPDTFVVDKASANIIEQRISSKDVMTVLTPQGTHEEPVPLDRRIQAALNPTQVAELARLGTQVEEFYGQPMDIEWAMKDGQIFIVQARPITALPESPATGTDLSCSSGATNGLAGTLNRSLQQKITDEWNDSLSGDYLWTNGNLGEAVPDVMTPCTWSLMQIFTDKAMAATSLNGYRLVGNIGGRCYMNLSLSATIATTFMSQQRYKKMIEPVFGHIPDNIEIPLIPKSRGKLLMATLREAVRIRRQVRIYTKQIPAFMQTAQTHCEKLRTQIQQASSPEDLLALWKNDLEPFFHESCYMLQAAGRQDGNALLRVRLELRKLMGETDANTLLSRQSELESLGPLLSLSRLARGEIDRATFARQYGHRGPHEFEVSIPRPAEDPGWIDKQLVGLREAPVDVPTLLERQKAVQVAAWERFRQRYPREAAKMRHRIDREVAAIRDREATRSEVIRVFWVLRTFVLRAGELCGRGEDLFFLTIDEILAVLGGNETSLASIPTRRTAYERYRALPPYPPLIRGHFDPFQWAADPRRRSDLFDEHDQSAASGSNTITGFPGAPGIVEGKVRVIPAVEEGDQLQPGEILVTTQTNIGWTPLFPRAAAIVTDVGAPLSHAAIVARELGIPAVVGSGNATTLLHTGDLVRVNGERGAVEVLTTAVNR